MLKLKNLKTYFPIRNGFFGGVSNYVKAVNNVTFDVYPGEEKILSENLQKIMENILKNKEIVLKSDVLIWDTWKETK